MKRFISLLLTVSMLLSLTACSGATSGSTGIGGLSGNSSGNSSSTPKVSYTDLLKMAGEDILQLGILTEHPGYSSLQIDGIDWETAMSYESDLFAALNDKKLAFYHNENDVLDCGDSGATNSSIYSEKIKKDDIVYVHSIQYGERLLFLAGDSLPDERTMWAMVGVPEEYLPESPILPFDGESVAEFIPVYDDLDPAARDYNGMPEDGLYIQFFHTDVTMDQVHACIQNALDMGYEDYYRGDMGDSRYDTYYFEGKLPNKVSIYLTYCDGTLLTSVLGPAYTPSSVWDDIINYNGGPVEDEPVFDWVTTCHDEMIELYIGDRLGTGTGMNSSGYAYWDMIKPDRATYNKCISDAQANGYTNIKEQTDNRYVAWKNIDFEGHDITLWVTINLEDDYFYCAVGLGYVEADRAPTP